MWAEVRIRRMFLEGPAKVNIRAPAGSRAGAGLAGWPAATHVLFFPRCASGK